MVRRLNTVLLLLCFSAASAWAGDAADFINLGFSADSEFFAFAQYGVQEEDLYPYTDIFVVDVSRNAFVADGVAREVYEQPITPGYDGASALYHSLQEHTTLLQSKAIRHTNTGRLVYVLMNGDEPKDELEFRDFETGNRYRVELIQSARGEEENVRSRFHIELDVSPESGRRESHTVGLPEYEREGVQGYRILQVIAAPDNASLVFVIELERYAERGADLRYMVETVDIQ